MTFYKFAKFLVSVWRIIKYDMTVNSKINIPDNKGFIVACNHQSNADPIIIGCSFKRQVNYMAKEELFKNKLFTKALNMAGTFKVSRGAGDTSAIDMAVNIVKTNRILGIFPEGTRSTDGMLRRAKSGAVLVAAKSGGDIIPVGINYGKKQFFRRKVVVNIGNIIPNEKFKLTDHNRAEIKVASAIIMDEISKLVGGVNFD